VKKGIRKYCKTHKNWDRNLQIITSTIRNVVNSSTGFTPNMLHLGRELHNPFTPTEKTTPITPAEHAYQMIKNMQKTYNEAYNTMSKTRLTRKNRYNESRQDHTFHVGQLVLKLNHQLSSTIDGIAASLIPIYDNQVYEITSQTGVNKFTIKEFKEVPDGSAKHEPITADQMRHYHPRATCLRNDETLALGASAERQN
jgi:hypothetical protein